MPRKIFLSVSLIVIFALYVLFQNNRAENRNIILPATDKNKRVILTPKPAPAPESAGSEAPVSVEGQAPKSGSLAAFKDGEFTGNIIDAYYGNVQVKAVIQGGKIIDVQFLDYPHHRDTSVAINDYAMPILKTEAIQAQSALVDAVSGATFTSQAFQESLTDALLQAKNQ